MKVSESIEIAAPIDVVWSYIADLQRMADWHVKLDSVRQPTPGVVRFGDRIETTYMLSGCRETAVSDVIRCQPPTGLTLCHCVVTHGCERIGEERFDLTPNGDSTCVDQEVEFSTAGLPWWVRGLIWYVTAFGRPVGEGILATLKRVCEEQAATQPTPFPSLPSEMSAYAELVK